MLVVVRIFITHSLSGRISNAVASCAGDTGCASHLLYTDLCMARNLHCLRHAHGVASCKVLGVTGSQ